MNGDNHIPVNTEGASNPDTRLPHRQLKHQQSQLYASNFKASMQFDDVIIQLGQFGKYQKLQYFPLCLPAILCAFHQLSSVFLAATPQFRCQLPESPLFNGTDTFEPQSEAHAAAISYYLPVSPEDLVSGNYSKFDENGKKWPSDYNSCHRRNLTEITACSEYVYSEEFMHSTIVTKLDLVCTVPKKIQVDTSTAVYMAGVMVGAFFFGILSDAIGRKKTLLICVFLQGSAGLATAFAPEYYSFILLRFVTGSVSMGLFMTCFVLGMELVGPKYRLICGVTIHYFFAIGYVLLSPLAYLTREWNYLQMTLSVPSFIFLSYYWFTNESARWLLSKDRVEEAEHIIQKAAVANNRRLPEKVFDSLEDESTRNHEKVTEIFKAKTLLIRSLVIFFNWMVISMSYYGLSLNSGTFGGNLFLNFMYAGLIEFPAYTVCFLCNRVGRKWMHVAGMMIGGFACLGTILVDLYAKDDANLNTYFVVLNTVGKFGMTMAFCIIYFWSAEIYPTGVRNSMMGFSSTMARVGSIAAPYIAGLGAYVPPEYEKVLPAAIFGGMVIIGGLLSIYLPETTGYTLPETIQEANLFPHHKTDDGMSSKANLVGEKETTFSEKYTMKDL